MLKFAILGKAGSGKNTLANIIAQDIFKLAPEKYKISAFAIKIKELISILFPNCNQEALYGSSELRQSKIKSDLDKILNVDTTYRQVALDLGKLGRSYHPAIWVAHLALEFYSLETNCELYIVSDVRFKEEYDWLKSEGFVLCRIKRDNLIKINDVSETKQEELKDSDFDIIIENNHSLEELRETATVAIKNYMSNNKTY